MQLVNVRCEGLNVDMCLHCVYMGNGATTDHKCE